MKLKSALSKVRTLLIDNRALSRLRENSSVTVGYPVRVSWSKISAEGENLIELANHVICRGAISCQKKGAAFSIGERSFVGSGTILVSTDRVIVGNDVLIAHDCYITDTDGHSLSSEIRKKDIPNRWKDFKDWSVVASAPVIIEDSVWIGPKVVILKGVTIGKGAIVCAGSVVTKSIPEMCMAAGVPAKIIRRTD
jgi:acetyltransferase-like isoleucine patch superfamily enzyme